MDANRAQEILQSSEKIRVEHNGVPVWIQSVDEGNATARVHTEARSDETMVVDVQELLEV